MGELVEDLEDGQPYRVQYFERVRLEYHPERPDPHYQVLLGQFGWRILADKLLHLRATSIFTPSTPISTPNRPTSGGMGRESPV